MSKMEKTPPSKVASAPPAVPEPYVEDEQLKRSPPRPAILPAVRRLLGPANLLPGEDEQQYKALLSGMAEAVKPRDFVEHTWVKDVADLAWSVQRYQRMKAAFLYQLDLFAAQARHAGGRAQGGPSSATEGELDIAPPAANSLLVLFGVEKGGDPGRSGIDQPHVLDVLERLDDMIATCMARRDRILREVTRRRAEVARLIDASWRDAMRGIEEEPSWRRRRS